MSRVVYIVSCTDVSSDAMYDQTIDSYDTEIIGVYRDMESAITEVMNNLRLDCEDVDLDRALQQLETEGMFYSIHCDFRYVIHKHALQLE